MYIKPRFLFVILTFLFIINSSYADQGSLLEKQPAELFTLTAISFNDTRVIDNFRFYPFYKQYLGRKVTVSIINEVCGDIMQLYNAAGFSSVLCFLPTQKIKAGVVEVYVDEGVISKVTLAGDVAQDDVLINSYIQKIVLNQPLDVEQLAHINRILNAISGIKVTNDLRAIPGTQQRELLFDVEKNAYNGEVYVNNRGSKAVGSVQVGLQLIGNSMFGQHEKMALHLLGSKDSDELKFVELGTVWPVGNAGSNIIFDSSYASSQPGDFLESLQIEVNAVTARLAWQKPLLWSTTSVFSVKGSLDYFKSHAFFSNALIEYSELYKVKLSLDYEVTGASRHTHSNLSFSHGLPGLNTTVNVFNAENVKGKEDFESVGFNFSHSMPVLNDFILFFQARGQYGFTDLPVSEYIAFGGEVFGSAYDPAEFLGNHGLGGRLRVNYQLNSPWLSSGYIQIFTQYDAVKVWNDDVNISLSGASASIGLIVGTAGFHLDLQVAKPLTRPVFIEGSDDVRYFGTLRLFF